MNFSDKTVLITGGTGSFGRKFTEIILKKYKPKKVIIFSRDEFKQYEMAKIFPKDKYPIRFFIGDIRDKDRLVRAFEGVDYVIHAAALKQVPALEYNPFEAVKTNILGAQNIVEAAIETNVKKVVALSTDKAVNPINLYGATKLAMEKIFITASSYAGAKNIKFCVVRYGNVVGSRGSVIPFFLNLAKQGVKKLPLTDERMTRFWITLEQGVDWVIDILKDSKGGEIFVPKIPSMRIVDLVKAISGNNLYKIIGIRPGEKIHETLINEDEGRSTIDMGKYFIILFQFEFEIESRLYYKGIPKVPENFIYRSNINDKWLSAGELKKMMKRIEVEQ
ncbi:MAG: UDP-N-acetylglucosamine 4,6-dehydratase (inverting) [bacterium]|nr:UDP-N-acetylglucosamine 4,6-dehydratase (inverting) [bacterium]